MLTHSDRPGYPRHIQLDTILFYIQTWHIKKYIFLAGDNVIVAGWGRTQDVPRIMRPEFLQALKVKIIDWFECKLVWPRNLEAHHICAAAPFKNAGACQARCFPNNSTYKNKTSSNKPFFSIPYKYWSL